MRSSTDGRKDAPMRSQLEASQSQIRSRERVIDLAEVFTHQREVKAMLDFVPEMFELVDSTFLEPACGNGNFLVEILERKLSLLENAECRTTVGWPEVLVLRAVMSVYAIDISEANVLEARERLRDVATNWCTQIGCAPSAAFRSALASVLDANLVCGDTLNQPQQVVFFEWKLVDGDSFVRVPFPLEEPQYDLFNAPPEPLPAVHYTQIGDLT